MTITLALAGDTMLGRLVAERLSTEPPSSIFAPGVVEIVRRADLFLLNLECCISERGSRWPASGKPFFFRAPPAAVQVLRHLGVSCVTLANNHALDFGYDALADTVDALDGAGIAHVGAGRDVEQARRPVVIEANGFRLGVVGVTDHPEDFAAAEDRPGVAYAGLRMGVPEWLNAVVKDVDADAVVVTPHWGPNMAGEPVPHVLQAASELVGAGATLIAGHSAHVFHGVKGNVLYDLGDFIDDYAVDGTLRNDLGLLFLVRLGPAGAEWCEAYPLALDFCHTRLASGEESAWVRRRFRHACAAMGTDVEERDGCLVVQMGP